MLPITMDMTREQCKSCLRCLELDAYGNMVSVLRAQGSFTDDKKRILNELAEVLHISNDRHRAEIRRAVNDEKLSEIADKLYGPNTWTDWAIEGRRTIPLIPRSKAHTAFIELANSLSIVIATANSKKRINYHDNSTINNKQQNDNNCSDDGDGVNNNNNISENFICSNSVVNSNNDNNLLTIEQNNQVNNNNNFNSVLSLHTKKHQRGEKRKNPYNDNNSLRKVRKYTINLDVNNLNSVVKNSTTISTASHEPIVIDDNLTVNTKNIKSSLTRKESLTSSSNDSVKICQETAKQNVDRVVDHRLNDEDNLTDETESSDELNDVSIFGDVDSCIEDGTRLIRNDNFTSKNYEADDYGNKSKRIVKAVDSNVKEDYNDFKNKTKVVESLSAMKNNIEDDLNKKNLHANIEDTKIKLDLESKKVETKITELNLERKVTELNMGEKNKESRVKDNVEMAMEKEIIDIIETNTEREIVEPVIEQQTDEVTLETKINEPVVEVNIASMTSIKENHEDLSVKTTIISSELEEKHTELVLETKEIVEPVLEIPKVCEPILEPTKIVEPAIETIEIVEPSLETTETIERVLETSETVEPAIETIDIAEPVSETIEIVEPVSEAIEIIEPVPETIEIVEPAIETIAIAEPVSETIEIVEPVSEAIEIIEPVPETIEIVEPAIETIAIAEPVSETIEIVEPVSEAIEIIEPVSEAIEIIEPVPETIEIIDPVPETIEISDPVFETTEIVEPHYEENIIFASNFEEKMVELNIETETDNIDISTNDVDPLLQSPIIDSNLDEIISPLPEIQIVSPELDNPILETKSISPKPEIKSISSILETKNPLLTQQNKTPNNLTTKIISPLLQTKLISPKQDTIIVPHQLQELNTISSSTQKIITTSLLDDKKSPLLIPNIIESNIDKKIIIPNSSTKIIGIQKNIIKPKVELKLLDSNLTQLIQQKLETTKIHKTDNISGNTTPTGSSPSTPVKSDLVTLSQIPLGNINRSPMAKVGITLNSDKTVSLSSLPNVKLGMKKKVIVVQKGLSKTVKLSQEVLDRVKGGKNLCITRNSGSFCLRPHKPKAGNNGDQIPKMVTLPGNFVNSKLKSDNNKILLNIKNNNKSLKIKVDKIDNLNINDYSHLNFHQNQQLNFEYNHSHLDINNLNNENIHNIVNTDEINNSYIKNIEKEYDDNIDYENHIASSIVSSSSVIINDNSHDNNVSLNLNNQDSINDLNGGFLNLPVDMHGDIVHQDSSHINTAEISNDIYMDEGEYLNDSDITSCKKDVFLPSDNEVYNFESNADNVCTIETDGTEITSEMDMFPTQIVSTGSQIETFTYLEEDTVEEFHNNHINEQQITHSELINEYEDNES